MKGSVLRYLYPNARNFWP